MIKKIAKKLGAKIKLLFGKKKRDEWGAVQIREMAKLGGKLVL